MLSFRKKKEDKDTPQKQSRTERFDRKPKKDKKAKDKAGKKDKEPKKPWGKAERVFVFGMLGGTALLAGVLAMSARSWKLPGLPRITGPNISLEQTYVLNGGRQGGVEASGQALVEFDKATRDLTGVYGLFVKDLKTGETYGQFETEVFQAASLIKLPVMAAMMIDAQEGDFDLDKNYTLKEEDKVGGAGSLQYEEADTIVTYRELLDLMGQESDNTAFNIVKNTLGEEVIEETIVDLGMRRTSLEENETTPSDIGKFFEKLWDGRIVTGEYQAEFISYLTDTVYEDHLPAGVPEDIQVAHKYGREVNVVNDAGIVFADDPYVVVIMTKGIVEPEADEIFPELSRIVSESNK